MSKPKGDSGSRNAKTNRGVGDEEERPSQLEQTQQRSPSQLTPPLHCLPYAACLLLTQPLPQTAALVTQQADHWDRLFQACYRNSVSAYQERFPSAPEPPGTSGSCTKQPADERGTIRAKGFLICPQHAAKHRAAHLCLHLYQHPPPKLTVLQPASCKNKDSTQPSSTHPRKSLQWYLAMLQAPVSEMKENASRHTFSPACALPG